MDKIILVYYLYKELYDNGEINSIMEKVRDDSMIQYFFKVNELNLMRVECINPKLISENEYEKVKEILNKNQEIVNEIIKNNNID